MIVNILFLKHQLSLFFILGNKVNKLDKQLEEEEKILQSIQEQKALMTVKELAKGITYTEALTTG